MNFRESSLYLRSRAEQARKDARLSKVVRLFLGACTVLTVLAFAVSAMNNGFGSFTVSVNRFRQLEYGLSLSETADFAAPTSRLNCRAAESITHFDGKRLDSVNLGARDGEDNGKDYLCYTFYCKNTGKQAVNYELSVNIGETTMGVEDAVRIRLIRAVNGKNRTQTDYAKAAGVDADGNAVAEPGTVPFYNKYTVMTDTVENFAPGDVEKFTVAVWLEGEDGQCLDDIIGGVFRIDMKFDVVGTSDTAG